MKVFTEEEILNIKKSTLILGSFELIHNGHLKLIKEAKKYNDPIIIMVIDDPSKLPKSKTKNAINIAMRLAQLSNLGVNYSYVIKINDKIINTDGGEFVKNIVAKTFAKRIIIGKDFKAGLNASYTSKKIKEDFKDVTIVDFVKINNIKLSSSIIKELLEIGDVETIKKLSPFPFQNIYKFNSKKTTNDFKKYSKIHPGIYACFCEVNDIVYWSLVHINISNIAEIFVPDLKIVNKSFDAKLWFHKKIRTIVFDKKDIITKQDKEFASKYLNTL